MEAQIYVEAAVEVRQRGPHLQGRPEGPFRIVLVGRGRPEQDHDLVADELVYRSIVALDDRHQIPETRVHERPDGLRIHALRERREAGQIREHDRDGPTVGVERGVPVRGRRRLAELAPEGGQSRFDDLVTECGTLGLERGNGGPDVSDVLIGTRHRRKILPFDPTKKEGPA